MHVASVTVTECAARSINTPDLSRMRVFGVDLINKIIAFGLDPINCRHF